MGNIKESLYNPGVRDVDTVISIINHCKIVLKNERDREKLNRYVYYRKIDGEKYCYLGGINILGNYLKLNADNNAHPLIKQLLLEDNDNDKGGVPFFSGGNITPYIDINFFTEREWVTRRGFVILTKKYVEEIIYEFPDINSINDIGLLLHMNFEKYGDIYFSETIVYEEGTDDIILEDEPEEEIEEEKKGFFKRLKEKILG